MESVLSLGNAIKSLVPSQVVLSDSALGAKIIVAATIVKFAGVACKGGQPRQTCHTGGRKIWSFRACGQISDKVFCFHSLESTF